MILSIPPKWLAFIGEALTKIYKRLLCQKWFIPTSMATTIICLVYNAIINPKGAINTFFIWLIDLVAWVFPSTPDNWKLGYLLLQFGNQFPAIGWGVIYEIFATIAGMLGLFLIIKLWKLLPFI